MKSNDAVFPVHILEVLQKLQSKGESYIYGGYLRDFILGEKYSDIDLYFNGDIHQIEMLFHNVHYTEKGILFGVCRFPYKGDLFEISSYPGESFQEMIANRDFKINSLYSEGKEITDQFGAKSDFDNKIVSCLGDFDISLLKKPDILIRAIRLASHLDFGLEESLFEKLIKNKEKMFQINDDRFIGEGYKIINGKNPYRSFLILKEMGFLKTNCEIEESFPFHVTNDPIWKLAYILYRHGDAFYNELTSLFKFGKQTLEKVFFKEKYFHLEFKDAKRKNDWIMAKKIQFHQNPEFAQELIRSNFKPGLE